MSPESIFGLLLGATLGFGAGQFLARRRSKPAAVHLPYLLAACGGSIGFAVAALLGAGQAFPRSPYLVEVDSDEMFTRLLTQAGEPVLVAFSSRYCPPCRRMLPALHALADRHAGQLRVARVNAPKVPEITDKYQVSGLPTLVVLDRGREVARREGYREAEELEALVREHLRSSPPAGGPDHGAPE